MMDANAFLKRMLLVVGISALSMVNVAHAHGGKGTGGSSGGGSSSSGASSSSSSGSGHSASSTSSGHSASSTSSGHSMSSTNGGHTTSASKGSHSTDPAQSGTNAHFQQGRFRVQPGHSSGYNSQNTVTTTEDQRKNKRLFLGFIRY
jgi:hypothetical protein